MAKEIETDRDGEMERQEVGGLGRFRQRYRERNGWGGGEGSP